MAGVALLGSPRSFMAKSSNFSDRAEKRCDASSARDIQPPGCHHDRTPTFSAVEPLGPPDFSGLAFYTLSVPGPALTMKTSPSTTTPSQSVGLSLQPQPVGSGHVAGSAQLETNRGSVSPSRERDADSGGDYERSIDQINFCFRNPSTNHNLAPVFGSQATTCVSMLQRI